MADTPEDSMMRDMRRIAQLVPRSHQSSPPGSLIARIYSLLPAPPEDQAFVFADSNAEFDHDPDSTTWTIVVADDTHIVRVRATAPFPSWVWVDSDDLGFKTGAFQAEHGAEISALRLALCGISKISTGGEALGWTTSFEVLPLVPRWILEWPDGSQIELPVSHATSRVKAWRAREFVLKLQAPSDHGRRRTA
jgi:hypothetical protein